MTETASDVARALGAMRRREEEVCPRRCGASFVGFTTKVYCSHACAVAQYHDDKREAVNAMRRRRYHERKACEG